MTKNDIIERIHVKTYLNKNEAGELVESVLELMKDTLATGETIRLSGFGSFTVREKTARRGRNPQTGEDLTIDARRVLTFKPSTTLRDAINS